MNGITSWDVYSDIEDEEDTFTPNLVNETTRKLLLRKYILFCKEALNVNFN